MKVAEVMTTNVQTCTPETNLAAAAMQMWNGDCGTLPVLDDDGKVVGMITDRDICIAAATNHRDIAELTVGDIAAGNVQSCTPEIAVRDALKLFGQARVRRLPVVDAQDHLKGILSIRDIVLLAGDERDKRTAGVSYADAVNTLKTICASHTKAASVGAS